MARGTPVVRASTGRRQPRKKDSSSAGPSKAPRTTRFQSLIGGTDHLSQYTNSTTGMARSIPPVTAISAYFKRGRVQASARQTWRRYRSLRIV